MINILYDMYVDILKYNHTIKQLNHDTMMLVDQSSIDFVFNLTSNNLYMLDNQSDETYILILNGQKVI